MSLDEINDLPPIFFPSEIDADRTIFYPVAEVSSAFDRMVGYFTSGVLAELAAAISTYLRSDTSAMRFIISPQLTEQDFVAITNAFNDEENFFDILFPTLSFDEDSLRNYTIAALTCLISQGKIPSACIDDG